MRNKNLAPAKINVETPKPMVATSRWVTDARCPCNLQPNETAYIRADLVKETNAEVIEALKNALHAMRNTNVPARDGTGNMVPVFPYGHPLIVSIRIAIQSAEELA